MNALIATALFAGVSTAAMAADPPTPASKDGLVCTKVYDPNQVAVIHMEVNRELTVQVAPDESVIKVTASDTKDLLYSIVEGRNIFWLMPLTSLPPQPLTVIATRPDGTPRVYLVQLDAKMPDTAPKMEAALSSPAAKPGPEGPCYLVRYTYPGDEAAKAKAAGNAAWQARQAQWKAAHDAQLLRENTLAHQNIHYVGIGDRNLAPDHIFDDGNSTFLEYDGNRPVPAPFGIGRDGKDKLLNGFTGEEGVCPGGTAQSATCLKLFSVAQKFRLRDQEDLAGTMPSLEIFNRAFNAVGNRPGTGTTNPSVEREVRSK